MPSILSSMVSEPVVLASSDLSPYDPPHRKSQEKSSLRASKQTGPLANGHGLDSSGAPKCIVDGIIFSAPNGVNSSLQSLPNGRSSGSTDSRDRMQLKPDSNFSILNGSGSGSGSGSFGEQEKQGVTQLNGTLNHALTQVEAPPPQGNRDEKNTPGAMSLEDTQTRIAKGAGHSRAHSASAPQRQVSQIPYPNHAEAYSTGSEINVVADKTLLVNRVSSSGNFPTASPHPATSSTSSLPPPRLQHRHTLQIPRVSTGRSSRDFSLPTSSPSGDGPVENERFSPTNQGFGRISASFGRRPTRSIHSDMYNDEIPPDEDTARWTETIKQKRASRRQRKEEEEEDRVLVGTKVDINHVNWVTAYNMLTGIRFVVSRINAKNDRELTDADFDAKHKFSFDVFGTELTPSAKYDFKFKDYAPWVFRRLRARFRIDPADYLMSLTSKYILSELGSPGKSGSFFYFSRDYKYIIKTIHHAEHKLLRKILREYYAHIEHNPNTLISQFYGLHRFKIPYGRKVHFVIMNNLFPPHRDIHQTFDLKGSTIGRDFKEEDLELTPRATLKDLNWLRRNYHFEFGTDKKQVFIDQMKKDVTLLQRLKIMDYSLLVGIHDLTKGNEENLRDKTLQVFQPGAERDAEPQPNMLLRTPSKLETAKKANELRQIIRREKPVPIDKSKSMLPDEMVEERKDFLFYGDDGGFRASHEDGRPGEEIYYLGVIDCLTHYGFIKRAEHLWKGLLNDKHQISPVPPEEYGERFIQFITSITMTKEEAEREKQSHDGRDGSFGANRRLSRTSTDKMVNKTGPHVSKSTVEGPPEGAISEKTLGPVRSPSPDKTNGVSAGATLPVVEEDGEANSREDSMHSEKPHGAKPGNAIKILGESHHPLLTPPNPSSAVPVSPAKDDRPSDQELPPIPFLARLSMSEALAAQAARAPTQA